MRQSSVFAVLCVVVLLSQAGFGQQAKSSAGCSLPEPQFTLNKPNIFSAQQEQWLGDTQAAGTEPAFDLLPEKDSAELDRIGQKLLAQLPPTPIHYHFKVYESEEANGFSIAGGYVYISRKLITDARSEDEVAGVLAHEIGHIYTHQVAIEYSRELKTKLNISAVTTRDDVEDKMQLMLDIPWNHRADMSEEDEEKNELLADRVGLYAMVRAGYAAKAFSQNLDRIAANKGKTGNFLTDMLGATSDIALRVRMARKIADSLSDDCKRTEPSSSADFTAFQEAIRNLPIHPLVPPTPELRSTRLEPAMRQPLVQVRFSPDGNYILAQDELSIHVLSRSPVKLLFSIDARWAQPAHFTPDSAHVVFHFPTMRVEKWNVATGKRESFHELVDYEGCKQSSLSPDGRTFICLSTTSGGVWLKMSDVETGKLFYDNKSFYLPTHYTPGSLVVRGASDVRVATVTYSQDGRTAVILAGIRAMAYDLGERKPISLGGDLSRLGDGQTAFVDSNKLVFECDWDYKGLTSRDTFKMCEASFPDGLPLNTFRVGYQWIEPVAKGNHVLIGPFKDSAAMLIDPSTGTASAGFKLDSMDLYGTQLASENEKGGVSTGELGSQKMEQADLPVGPMMSMEAAAFSPDGHFLAYSSKARSSIWDLNTAKRVALMRPFREVRFDDQNVMHAQYQQANRKPGANFQVDLKTGKATEAAKYAIDQFQRSDVLVTFQPQEKSGSIDSNVILQVADQATGAQLWTRRYPHATPIVRGADDSSLVLFTDLRDDTALDDAKHAGAKLVKSSDTKSAWISQGLLIEIVDSHTGELKRAIQVPALPGSGEVWRNVALYGGYVVVRGISNNSVIYRLSDGARTGAFWGRSIAGDSTLGLIAATNNDQETILYDAATGKEVKRVTLDQFPRAARFIPAKNALLVLTASQSVYTIDLPGSGHAVVAQAK